MKMYSKVALVAAMAVSANAMALQAMDDDALSATTGQDGITMGIALGASGITIGKVYVHDNDGNKVGTTNGTAGAIAINGLTVKQNTAGNLATLKIDSDGAAAGAYLNIAATVAGLDLGIGSIAVGKSGTLTAATAVRGTEATTEKDIITGLNLKLGEIGANIQLGSTPQGAMVKLNTTLKGGLDISDFGIKDAVNGGEIFLKKISVRGNGNTTGDLAVLADVNVKTTGLEIVNKGTQGINTYIQGVHLGSQAATSSIGDVEIQNLNLAGSIITISGH